MQYFTEDSGELWKVHCQREFRGSEPADMESWREMYLVYIYMFCFALASKRTSTTFVIISNVILPRLKISHPLILTA